MEQQNSIVLFLKSKKICGIYRYILYILFLQSSTNQLDQLSRIDRGLFFSSSALKENIKKIGQMSFFLLSYSYPFAFYCLFSISFLPSGHFYLHFSHLASRFLYPFIRKHNKAIHMVGEFFLKRNYIQNHIIIMQASKIFIILALYSHYL